MKGIYCFINKINQKKYVGQSIEIRKKFVNHTLDELYQEYKEKYSFSGLKKIVYGVNHKHLPIYKKKEQKWYLNGSCIDYPG